MKPTFKIRTLALTERKNQSAIFDSLQFENIKIELELISEGDTSNITNQDIIKQIMILMEKLNVE